jgi:hypothetical protein
VHVLPNKASTDRNGSKKEACPEQSVLGRKEHKEESCGMAGEKEILS